MNRKAFKLEKNELVKIEVILQNKVFHPYCSTALKCRDFAVTLTVLGWGTKISRKYADWQANGIHFSSIFSFLLLKLIFWREFCRKGIFDKTRAVIEEKFKIRLLLSVLTSRCVSSTLSKWRKTINIHRTKRIRVAPSMISGFFLPWSPGF